MDYLQLDEPPTLRRPTFLAAFRGWNDAGEAATLAVRHLVESWSAKQFAAIGPVTAATVEELLGRPPDVVAREHTIAGLVSALVQDAGG